MIHAVIIFNTQGKPRLIKFYDAYYPPDIQGEIIHNLYQLVHNRRPTECHFVETDIFQVANRQIRGVTQHTPDDLLLMYRQYATLYIIFCVDRGENELAILDLIQIFVEAMDRCFDAVCELDLIFNVNKIHFILNEIIVGGLVMETNLEVIMDHYREQKKRESEAEKERKAVKTMAKIRNKMDFEGRFKKFKKNVKENLAKKNHNLDY